MSVKIIAVVGDKAFGVTNIGSRCCPHSWTATISSSSAKCKSGGKGIARHGDSATTTCPHFPTGTIISSSSTVKTDTKGTARQGDKIKVGPATAPISVLGGSNKVKAS